MSFFCYIACLLFIFLFFFFNDPPTTEIYTLSLHDALPIWRHRARPPGRLDRQPSHHHCAPRARAHRRLRSEEHTSELQSRRDLVCRLLLEKKKKKETKYKHTTRKQHDDT